MIPEERIDLEEDGQWDRIRVKYRITDNFDPEVFKKMLKEALEHYRL